MVECACLESMCTRKGTEGSNPSLSASLRQAYGWQAGGGVTYIGDRGVEYAAEAARRHPEQDTVRNTGASGANAEIQALGTPTQNGNVRERGWIAQTECAPLRE